MSYESQSATTIGRGIELNTEVNQVLQFYKGCEKERGSQRPSQGDVGVKPTIRGDASSVVAVPIPSAAPSFIRAETLGKCQAQNFLRTSDCTFPLPMTGEEQSPLYIKGGLTSSHKYSGKCIVFGGHVLECGVCDDSKYTLDLSRSRLN